MKFIIEPNEIGFFARERYIELADLLDSKELETLKEHCDKIQIQDSFNFWLKEPTWRREPFLRHAAETAAQLCSQKSAHLGFIELISKGKICQSSLFNFKSSSPFQGLFCGLVIALEDYEEAPILPFPKKAGNGLFFFPSLTFKESLAPARSLLITFLEASSRFFCNRQDPHLAFWMERGYSAGDKLKERLNPLLYHV